MSASADPNDITADHLLLLIFLLPINLARAFMTSAGTKLLIPFATRCDATLPNITSLPCMLDLRSRLRFRQVSASLPCHLLESCQLLYEAVEL